MKKPLIIFDNFTFQYDSQAEPTLCDLNLTIYEGEKIAVVGPSGSGKSTFAQCINGLIPHSFAGEIQGSVEINGKNLQKSSLFELSFEVGTVLQDPDGQFIGLTVAEDIAFSLENDCVPQTKMLEAVHKWAKVVDIDQQLNQRPQDLSGGQKQRVSMAGVLIDEVPVLLFDEPLANLDPASGKQAIELIDEIHRQSETTIVIIEHRLEDVLHCEVDRILVFEEGRIISDSTPDELLKSDILSDTGIREPLYITAMKYAGIDLAELQEISDIHKVAGPKLKEEMEQWLAAIPDFNVPTHHEPLLELSGLSYRYNKDRPLVLDSVSVTFHKGEMVSVVGKNGAGKSTLSKAICGFVGLQEGSMNWLGEDFTKLSIKERADKIGYVMQNPNQMISKTLIFDEVALGLILRGVAPEEIEKRVHRVLKICGLYAFRSWPISALSFGQKKRVTIAAILVLNPAMIILDEPTAGQDFKHYTEMMNFLETLNKQGVTVVMITHDMHLMLEYTTRALVIANGQLLADTESVDVLTNDGLIHEASLKETSLFTFAKALGMQDPFGFTKKFIAYDREVRLP
ncbi:ABC transporter ATP-binding protein [Carnobacterium gallinarum]|uniref:ABC transporter ATP-binding protein n=1 Tax=Carnobacterium gallinarum TaxID=2749 RepID=UPI000552DA31|nr:ABC transporter ATP-binding protein [Carnobacterium gallinarum]